MSQIIIQQGDGIDAFQAANQVIGKAKPVYDRLLGAPQYQHRFLCLRNERSPHYQSNLDVLKHFEKYMDDNDIEHIVHLGIGGSGLGPELVYDYLSFSNTPKVSVSFFSSFDPRLERLLSTLNLAKTVFIFVSKSFTTDEMLWQLSKVKCYLAKAKQSTHLFAITSNKHGALEHGFADQNILNIPDEVGGRFSVWSTVSAVNVAAFGFDMFEQFLQGAAQADIISYSTNLEENIALKMALQAYYCLQVLKLPTRAICAYHPALSKLVPYLQQLEMESLGKQIGLDGQPIAGLTCSVVWGGVGTNVQHSVFQYLMQHSLKSPIDFIVVDHEDDSSMRYKAHLNAQIQILKNGYKGECVADEVLPNPLYQLFDLKDLSAQTLGYLLSLFEHKVIWLASMLNLDPFTQPGVQAAKSVLMK